MKTTAPIICILNSEHKAARWGLSNRGRFDSPGQVWSWKSVGATSGMRCESWHRDTGGNGVPRSLSRYQDKYRGGNKVLQTNPLEITRDTSVPTIWSPTLTLGLKCQTRISFITITVLLPWIFKCLFTLSLRKALTVKQIIKLSVAQWAIESFCSFIN